MLMLSFPFHHRGGGGVEVMPEMKDIDLGSLELNVSLEEMSHYTFRGSSLK